tara:strand:+ start:4991 stop:5536 length:546 start_codon:yes stop_codon:yes gene_type:complete
MANYNKVLLWIPNDTINIPQFPDYASGFNGGIGPNVDDAAAKFITGPNPVAIGDVLITYDANNFPVEIAQVVNIINDISLEVDVNVSPQNYRIYRSNGGSPNIKQGYDGYKFRVSSVSDIAINHDLNIIAAGQDVETVLSQAWNGSSTRANSAYFDIRATRILATGSATVSVVTVLDEADN